MTSQILTEIKTLLKNGEDVKVIFDLDSTLFDVSPRIAQILREFAAEPEMEQRYPSESAILKKVEAHPADYGIKRTLQRYQFPFRDMEFFKLLVEFWKKKFFSDDYLKYDQPYEGAKDFVQQLSKEGAEILYLTGRDIPRMKKGTVESLIEHGFPVLSEDHLMLKPNTEIGDVEFKKNYFEKMEHKHVWFFENEPANILVVLDIAPHVQVVFVDTVHSGTGPLPPENVMRITSWKA